MDSEYLNTPYYQQWSQPNFVYRDQPQNPPTLTLQHSNDSTDLSMWNSMTTQPGSIQFGGPPVTQTVTLPATEDLSYSAATTTAGMAMITPPLSSTNPAGFYGWSVGQPVAQDPTYLPQEPSGAFVMTPESDAEPTFTYTKPYSTASPQHTSQSIYQPQQQATAAASYFSALPEPTFPRQFIQHPHPGMVVDNTTFLKASPPPSPMLLISPVANAASIAMQMRRQSAEEMSQTHMVKLTKMTPDRIEHIKQLAQEKGINPQTVEAVLTLYTPTGRRQYMQNVGGMDPSQLSSQLCGDDIFIRITMNGGYDTSSSSGGSSPEYRQNGMRKSSKSQRKSNPNYVKRPLNSFMLYRKSQTQSAMAYAVHSQLKLNHQNISQIIGLMWQTESKEVKDQFARFAGKEKELHRVLHPNYKFCPQKKKRKD